MPDNELSFSTRVDLSGLNTNLDEAVDTVEGFAGSLSDAMQAATDAANLLADAQKELGAAAEQGSAQAAQVIAEYQASLESARASVEALKAAEGASADALDRSTGSAATLATENATLSRTAITASDSELLLGRSALEAAAGQEAAARAAGHQVTALQATSGTIRELNGSLPLRAVENFISKTLGLGPILQAAFPVVGAIALGEVLVGLGEKLYKAYEDAENAGKAIEKAWKEENDALQLSNDSLTVTNDKLENTLLKLEHKPGNGLQLALDQSRQSADQLANSLQKDLDKVTELLSKNQVGLFGQLMGKPGTADTTKMVQGIASQIAKVKDDFQEDIDNASNRGDSENNIVSLKTQEMTALEKVYSDAEAKIKPILHSMQQDLDIYKESNGGRGADTSANVAILRGFLKQLDDEQKTIGESFRGDTLRDQIDPLKAQEKSPKSKEDQEYLRYLEDTLAKENEVRQRSAGELASYWAQYVNVFNEGSTEYRTVQNNLTRAVEENHRKLVQERKAQTEETHKQDMLDLQGAEAVAKGLQASHKMMEQVYEQQATSQHDKNQGQIQLQETKVEAGSSLGITDPKKDLEMLRDLHQQAIAEDERYIQQELAIYAKEPEKIAELQKKLELDHNKSMTQQLQDTTKILQLQEQTFKKVYGSITQDFNSAITKMITTTEKPAQAFAQMLNQMLGQLANFVLQYLEKKAEMWLLDEILGKSTATSAAVTQITASAAAAGAGAYAAIAPIPIVGPELAPGAAAASYAGALSFLSLAAFEAGGVVAGGHNMPVPIMAHAGERVLSAPQTQKFDSMVNGGAGSRGNSVHLNYNPQVSAYDKTGVSSMLRSHMSDIHSMVNEGIRSGSIKARG